MSVQKGDNQSLWFDLCSRWWCYVSSLELLLVCPKSSLHLLATSPCCCAAISASVSGILFGQKPLFLVSNTPQSLRSSSASQIQVHMSTTLSLCIAVIMHQCRLFAARRLQPFAAASLSDHVALHQTVNFTSRLVLSDLCSL
jgi:hypothetical protein